MEAVSALSARLTGLPDVVDDADASDLAELLANAGCALTSVAVQAGQRDKDRIMRDACVDLMARSVRR